MTPNYAFPDELVVLNSDNKSNGFYPTIAILCLLFILSIIGYFVEYKSLGNKSNNKAMVDTFE